MRKVLVYDKAYSGHHAEYFQHIVDHVSAIQDIDVHFYLHPHNKLLTTSLTNITLHYIDEKLIKGWLNTKSLIKRSIKEIQHLFDFSKNLKTKEIIFLDLDPYQYALGSLKIKNSGFHLYGILFRPFFRIQKTKTRGILATAFLKWRKKFQLRWILKNKDVKKVFILNDERVASSLNNSLGTNVFRKLVDPIKVLEKNNNTSARSLTKNLLIFGSLDERKNIANICEALKELSLTENIVLKIIGRPRPLSFESTIRNFLSKLKEKNPKISIEFKPEFVSHQELSDVLSRTDLILIPYIDFYFSSGIIGHAAQFNIPLMASNYGIVGELVEKYNLGYTVNPDSATDIKNAFSSFFSKPKIIDGRPYINDHQASYFVSSLFQRANV